MKFAANKRSALVLLVFVILGFLIYSNTLDVPFHFDDESNIVENPNIRLTGLSLKDITGTCFTKSVLSGKKPDMNVEELQNNPGTLGTNVPQGVPGTNVPQGVPSPKGSLCANVPDFSAKMKRRFCYCIFLIDMLYIII